MLISVGTSAVPCSTISVDGVVGEPVPCSMQSMPALISPGSASSLKTCAVTRAPSACAAVDRRLQHVVGPQRRQIADAAVDPVADQLDPAVAPARLLGDRRGQLRFVLELDRRSRACSAWAGPDGVRHG